MSDTNVHRVVGNLLVGTSHFFVDTTTNQIGVNTSTPSSALDVASGDLKVGSDITIGNSGTITAANFSGNGSGLSGINSDSGSWVNGNNSNVHLAVSTDKVGIATTTPMTKLDITYNAAAPAIVFSDTTNSRYQTGIGSLHVSNEGQRLDFYTGDSLTNGTLLTDSPRMCITGTGNVGIGTSSPGTMLHIETPTGTSSNYVRIGSGMNDGSSQSISGIQFHTNPQFYNGDNAQRVPGQIRSGFYNGSAGTANWADAYISFLTPNNPSSDALAHALTIRGGNVGVGSTSPTGRLEVAYTEGTLSSYSYATSSTWHNKGLALKGGNAGFLYGHDINHSIFLRQSPFGSTDHNAYCNVGYHAFYTGGHIQDQTEKMRIASDGVISISKYIEHKLISEASFVWDPSNTGTWNNHSNNIYNALGGNAYKATIIGGFQFHPDHIQATNNQFSIETDNTLDLRRSWTIVSWQRVTSGELTHIRVGGHGTTGGSQGLHIQGLGAEGMRYGMYSNDVDAGTNSGLRKTDKWAQYTATYSHTGTVNKKLYQNARLVADDRGTNTYNSSGTNGYPQYAAAPTKFRVGQSYSSGVYTTDSNTNLRVGPTLVFLDRVLDQSEVRALYEHYRMKYNGA